MTDPADIRARFLALFGHGWQALYAQAAECHPVNVSQWLGGAKPLPADLVANLEWLESTPVNKWPERWNRLADLARNKAKKDKAA